MDKIETEITVKGRVNWLSDDKKQVLVQGFGYVYLNEPAVVSKGEAIFLGVRLWEKETESGGKLKRFYEV